MDPMPLLGQQLPLISLEHALRGADDIAAPALLENLHVLFRDRATIQHPDPGGPSMQLFDMLDDLFQWQSGR